MIDQLGKKMEVKKKPQKVVSIVPSISEFLSDAGLGERLVGVTKFCVHPLSLKKEKTIIGGTKNINVSKIKSLSPDLIIANKEENVLSDIEQLREFCPVWISDIKNEDHAFDMMKSLVELLDLNYSVNELQERYSKFIVKREYKESSLYLIWNNPFMSVGSDTYIHRMLDICGYRNVCGHLNRYPVLTESEIVELNPFHVFLSSEPFPFKNKHAEELQKILPHARIILVDGEMFSWYGSRMSLALDYFQKL